MPTIYRAMCQSEYEQTIKTGKPVFIKRFKWFSTSLDHIKSRVQDGKFNNSRYKDGAYQFIVAFEVENLDRFKQVGNNELMLDRRSNIRVEVKL